MNSSFLSVENESLSVALQDDKLEDKLEESDSFLQICQLDSSLTCSQNSEDFNFISLPDFNSLDATSTPLHSTPVKQTERNKAVLGSSRSPIDEPFEASCSIILGEAGREEDSENSFLMMPEQQPVEDVSPDAKKRKVQLLPCCSNCCLANVDSKPLTSFVAKSTIEQNQFLMDSFNLLSNEGNGIQHMIAGKLVCKKAFILYFKISNKRYERIFEQFTRNPTVKIQRKPVIRSESVKVTEAKAWMTQYFKRIGDSMPHVEQTHLPHGLTKQDIYQIMKREILQQGVSSTISLSHFYVIWDTSFKNVLIPKVSTYIASYFINSFTIYVLYVHV